MEPESREPGSGAPMRSSPLSPAERGQIRRAAALRPLNVMMLVIGVGVFATTLAWWVPLLTLLTYVLLVFFSARDPIFGRRVLHGREEMNRASGVGNDVSPERRARWLPRGETRERVEAALVVYRKVVVAIEESDEVTRAVLDDAVPKLHAAADRLVDVAQGREKSAEILRDFRQHAGASAASEAEGGDIGALQERVRAADAEISDTLERLLALRSRVVRISIESGGPEGVTALNSSLDELNARLEALSDTMGPPEAPAAREH